jgi:hypothetical protein
MRRRARHVVHRLALLWMPTLSTVRMGQCGHSSCWALSDSSGRSPAGKWPPGLFFALTAAKPRLIALVWVAALILFGCGMEGGHAKPPGSMWGA